MGIITLIDNASYHSRKKSGTPNSTTKKADLQSWLRNEAKVEFSPTLKRPQLWDLVKAELRRKPALPVVDQMASDQGVILERLPPYHCMMNAIEQLWAEVKGFVRIRNGSFKMNDVRSLTLDGLRSVKPETCAKYVANSQRWEHHFSELDHLDILELTGVKVAPVIIPLNESSTEEESEDGQSPSMDLVDFIFSNDENNSTNNNNNNSSSTKKCQHVFLSRKISLSASPSPRIRATFISKKLKISCKKSLKKKVKNDNNSKKKPASYLKCDNCDIKFTGQWAKKNLAKHSRRGKCKASKPVEFKCDKCDRVFHRKSCLTNHYGTHKMCEICGKQFDGKRARDQLKQHANNKKGCTPAKQLVLWPCEQCFKTFRWPSHLNRHKMSCCNEIKCDKCNKTFQRHQDLKIHKCSVF